MRQTDRAQAHVLGLIDELNIQIIDPVCVLVPLGCAYARAALGSATQETSVICDFDANMQWIFSVAKLVNEQNAFSVLERFAKLLLVDCLCTSVES